MKHTILIITLSFALTLNLDAQVRINEIMQSNIDCVMDDINEFPDSWIELYNTSSSAVSLRGYKVGISKNPSEAWEIPSSKSIAAHKFFLIYCDKEGTGLHTNFRIDSGKGAEVYLFKDNTIVDKITGLAKQPAPNVAYGRQFENSDEWGYQQTPTPNYNNCGILCSKILGEPVFSVPGKVVTGTSSIRLLISLPQDAPEGTVIRVTYDGSEPTESSTSLGSKSTIMINSTKVIRAKLFCNGYLSPRSTTHSYIFFPRQLSLPVVSIVTDDKYFSDSKLGIYVNGSYSSSKRNYEYDWRRPINFEYFNGEGEASSLNQLCETRVQGGATRANALKSLAVYANKRFGEKQLKYEFFPDQRPGIAKFKSILLRSAGNDFDYLYMRDAIIQRSMASHVDLDWQAWRPVIFYLNGTYKGMLNIRERSNEDNIFSNYDGLEDIDMIENWKELKQGSKQSFDEFRDFYNQTAHTWTEYNTRMDCTEFTNLMIMNIYFNNQDFPGNNIVQWRPSAEGGRWRWIAKDTDFGLGLYGSPATYNTFEWLYNPNYDAGRAWANHPEHTKLFRNLMNNAKFKREFIDRFAVYMGDFLNFDGIWEVWQPMYSMIQSEYPYHREQVSGWSPDYEGEVQSVQAWIKDRNENVYSQMGKFYSLGNSVAMTVNADLTDAQLQTVRITFNDIELSRGRFNGMFYANREVHLKGSVAGNVGVTGWTITTIPPRGATTTIEVIGNDCTFSMPQCRKVEVSAIIGELNTPGDANLDGKVDVSDITAVAAYILSSATAPFSPQNADANRDGSIDVSDITTIAANILGNK